MYLEFTNILSKCVVAEKKKKKVVIVFINSSGLTLLNFLWGKGFIYGYSKEGFKVTIYLKSLQTGRGFFSNLLFLGGKKHSLVSLKKKAKLNTNDFYFLISSKGVLSIKESIGFHVGGYLLGKL